jgi:predicted nucleic acid-binding protein
MTVVLDASVILKWLLEDPDTEPDTDKAIQVVQTVINGTVEILQPVHWLAEVAGVLARVSPDTAIEDIDMLAACQFPVSDEPGVMHRATTLAIETGQHLFDTLYHAVALEKDDAMLITADNRYCAKARGQGRVIALHDWEMAI